MIPIEKVLTVSRSQIKNVNKIKIWMTIFDSVSNKDDFDFLVNYVFKVPCITNLEALKECLVQMLILSEHTRETVETIDWSTVCKRGRKK